MSWDVGAIKGGVEWDYSQFVRGMREMKATAALWPSWVNSYILAPLAQVKNFGAEAFGWVKSLAFDSLGAIEDMGDMAENLGVSAKELSTLKWSAKTKDIGLEELGESLKFIGRNAADAVNGNKQMAESFARLGMDSQFLAENMRDPIALLYAVADGMKDVEAGGQRTAVAMDVAGRSGTKFVGWLSEGSAAMKQWQQRAREMGLEVTDSALAQAEAWKITQIEFQMVWQRIRNELAQPIRDALMPYLQRLMDWIKTNPEELLATVRNIGETIAGVLKFIGEMAIWSASHMKTTIVLMATLRGMQAGAAFGPKGAIAGAAIGAVGSIALVSSMPSFNTPAPTPTHVNYTTNVSLQQSDKSLRRLGDEFADKVGEAQNRQQARLSAEIVKGRI